MPNVRDIKIFSHPVEKVFDVVMGLENYHHILPYIKSVKILSKQNNGIKALITVSLKMFEFSYQCDVHYKNNELIEVTSDDSLFKKFSANCFFEKIEKNRTKAVYTLNMEFTNPLLELISRIALPYQARTTTNYFEDYLVRS